MVIDTIEKTIEQQIDAEMDEMIAKGYANDQVADYYYTHRRMTLAMQAGRYQRLCEKYGHENAVECITENVPEWWYEHKPSFHRSETGYPDDIFDYEDDLSEEDKAIISADYWADVRKKRTCQKRRWQPSHMEDDQVVATYAEYQQVKGWIHAWRWQHDAAWLRLIERYVKLSRELNIPNALLIVDVSHPEQKNVC